VADDVATVGSSGSLWRVGRNPEALTVAAPTAHDLRGKRAGNRFDIPGVGVLYCASTLEGCFAETLARFRPKLDLAELVADEWKAAGHLRPGSVPAGWRHRRTAVEVAVDPGYRFLDVDHLDTHQVLRGELALGLAALGYSDLDTGLIRGPDRRVTRLVAAWAHQQMADGDGELYTLRRDQVRVAAEHRLGVLGHLPRGRARPAPGAAGRVGHAGAGLRGRAIRPAGVLRRRPKLVATLRSAL